MCINFILRMLLKVFKSNHTFELYFKASLNLDSISKRKPLWAVFQSENHFVQYFKAKITLKSIPKQMYFEQNPKVRDA